MGAYPVFQWARDGVGGLASLSFAVPVWNRHCQKLTVFSPSANSSATLPQADFRADSVLAQSFLMSVTVVVGVMSLTSVWARWSRFDPANSRQYPRTVARTWRYGCDPAPPGAAPVRRTSLPTADRVTPVMRIHAGGAWGPDATRSDSRGQGQADFSAQQPPPGASARVPAADAYPRRPGDRVGSAPQGPPFTDCVMRRKV